MNTPTGTKTQADFGVLEGIRVLDFSTLLPGPMAGLMLAEAGAEVIKVERPGGEDMRRHEAEFAMLNRGKGSIEIDLKSPDALQRLLPLVATADVLIEQFRPGVMERLGLGYATLRALNPRLVYCAINGYGADGSHAQAAGHDLSYAAQSGLLAQSGAADGAPVMPPTLIADIGGGAYPAMINILLALVQRQKTGAGAYIEIAMYDQVFPFLQPAFASAFGEAHWPQPNDGRATGASPRYALYRCRDGRHLAAAPAEQKFWDAFCDAIALPAHWRDDAVDPAGTKQAVAAIVATRTAAEWEAAFAGRDVACSTVLSFEEAVASPLFVERSLLDSRVDFAGRSLPALPVPVVAAFRGRQAVTRRAPVLGQDNALLEPAGRPA